MALRLYGMDILKVSTPLNFANITSYSSHTSNFASVAILWRCIVLQVTPPLSSTYIHKQSNSPASPLIPFSSGLRLVPISPAGCAHEERPHPAVTDLGPRMRVFDLGISAVWFRGRGYLLRGFIYCLIRFYPFLAVSNLLKTCLTHYGCMKYAIRRGLGVFYVVSFRFKLSWQWTRGGLLKLDVYSPWLMPVTLCGRT